MSEQLLRSLAETFWGEVASRIDVVDGQRVRIPAVETAQYDPELAGSGSRNLPVLRYLDAALEGMRESGLAKLANQVSRLRTQLIWSQNRSYSTDNVGAEFLASYAYGLLSGPEGPLQCPCPYAGFLLMGPDLLYTDHKHEPREVYFILTPGAEWRLDHGDWFPVHPGEVVLHSAWRPHATRTHDAPFLAFVAWLDEGTRSDIEI